MCPTVKVMEAAKSDLASLLKMEQCFISLVQRLPERQNLVAGRTWLFLCLNKNHNITFKGENVQNL